MFLIGVLWNIFWVIFNFLVSVYMSFSVSLYIKKYKWCVGYFMVYFEKVWYVWYFILCYWNIMVNIINEVCGGNCIFVFWLVVFFLLVSEWDFLFVLIEFNCCFIFVGDELESSCVIGECEKVVVLIMVCCYLLLFFLFGFC